MTAFDQIRFCRTRKELDDVTDCAKLDHAKGGISDDELRNILRTAYAQRRWVR